MSGGGLALLLAALAPACDHARHGDRAGAVAMSGVPAAPTWSRDVAPIVFRSCAPCHRPGEVAPFSLLTHDDVRRRARLVAEVTGSRYMPPWLPAPGRGRFVGERRLADEEVETLRRWVEAGAPEGNPADLPPAPHWAEGWQLGEPDLVVSPPEPFILPAEGMDVFRNFVIPAPVREPRWVRSVEFRPGSPSVVHHLNVRLDRTGDARRLDADHPEPGFPEMEIPGARVAEGQLLAWSPGKTPTPGDPDLAWRLEPGTDLVLQVHLLPSGRPEPIQPRVGLHFTDV